MSLSRRFSCLLTALFMGGILIACQGPDSRPEAAGFDRAEPERDIRRVLSAQTAAWNNGDIKAFMASYWASPELRFASGGSIERGWTPTLERYLSRYPDKAAMGTLFFTELEIEVIDADDALVFGHWALERQSDRPSGLFTLHFKKQNEQWVIISDHTSSAQP